MKILHLNQNKEWVSVSRKHYDNEAQLQDLLEKDVNILPFEEIYPEIPFVTIGKEIELSNGALDLLAVSPQGHIGLIETKLDKNPEVKRTVVGQILGYAAYLWNKSYKDIENEYFRKFLDRQKIEFDGNLAEYVKEKTGDSDFSEVDFKAGIEKRLQFGSFTLLIVVDQVNQELEDIANYLNDRTGKEIDFYVAEIESIGDKDEHFLIPRLTNPLRKNVTHGKSKNQDDYDRTPVTKEEFLQRLSTTERNLANRLLEEFENSPDVILSWRKGGFSLMAKLPEQLQKKWDYAKSFSYLFFKAGDQDNPERKELAFWYPEDVYKRENGIRPFVKEYVKFYRSIDGFDKRRKIKDLSVFDKKKTEKLIELIKKTANKLNKSS